jgi:hypothetical protein
MAQTVTECLTAATDSVTLINAVNGGSHDAEGITQEKLNEMVQRNVDHLEIILAYDGTNNTPDVAGDSSDKSSYTTAITTGTNYIAAN